MAEVLWPAGIVYVRSAIVYSGASFFSVRLLRPRRGPLSAFHLVACEVHRSSRIVKEEYEYKSNVAAHFRERTETLYRFSTPTQLESSALLLLPIHT